MRIFIYSDESGVFDKKHNDIFVYGGLILLSKEQKEEAAQRYSHAKKTVREKLSFNPKKEVKATTIPTKYRPVLYKSMKAYIKFGVVIRQKSVHDKIYVNKKTKQRFLDYAYKRGVKSCLRRLINEKIIEPDDVEEIYVFADEHTTATDGRYELRESLEMEFKIGTFNFNWEKFFPPLFPKLKVVNLSLCNSESQTLIRAADIIANKLLKYTENERLMSISCEINVLELP